MQSSKAFSIFKSLPNLLVQSTTHQNQPLVCQNHSFSFKVWKCNNRSDLFCKSWLAIWFGEVICNCTQPHGAWGILGQPLVAFSHHATNLQANVSCKLCIKIRSSNGGIIQQVYAVCSLLINNVNVRLIIMIFFKKNCTHLRLQLCCLNGFPVTPGSVCRWRKACCPRWAERSWSRTPLTDRTAGLELAARSHNHIWKRRQCCQCHCASHGQMLMMMCLSPYPLFWGCCHLHSSPCSRCRCYNNIYPRLIW